MSRQWQLLLRDIRVVLPKNEAGQKDWIEKTVVSTKTGIRKGTGSRKKGLLGTWFLPRGNI